MTPNASEGTAGGLRPPRLLLVGSDEEIRGLLTRVLGGAGFGVVGVSNESEALTCPRRESFAAIVFHKSTPGSTSLDLLPGWRTICAEVPIVTITAMGEVAFSLKAPVEGSFEDIITPCQLERLLRAVYDALHLSARPRQASVASRVGF